MDQALTILFELLVLIGFGYLYYLFQKRKIIRRDQIEIIQIIDEFILDHTDIEKASDYLANLKETSHARDYKNLLELLRNPDTNLPIDAQDFLKDMDDRILFLVRKS